jgi:hypothetical protein
MQGSKRAHERLSFLWTDPDMSFFGPLTFYHWLVGTIIVAWCTTELFYRPRGSVIPFQFMSIFVSVAALLFIWNGFAVQDEIYYCLAGAALSFGISFFFSFVIL